MVRSGREFLARWTASPLEVWYQGQRTAPSRLAKFRRQARVIATYYDQHLRDPAVNVEGEGAGAYSVTLLPPTSAANLRRKARCYESLAQNYLGLLGRPPDYINVVLSTWEAQAKLFGPYAQNLIRYVECVRRNDWFVTHSTSELKGPRAGIRIVGEVREGLVLTGARAMATSAALSDELLIAPTRLADGEVDKAIICAVPTHTPGLKLVCRKGFESGSDLAEDFDESDALIILENVVVPWSRIFARQDLTAYRTIVKQTGTSLACSLQTNARAIAKLEFIVSILRAWQKIYPDAGGRLNVSSGLVLRDLRILRALQAAAVRDAQPRGACWHPHDESVEAAKIYFMESYPALIANLRRDLGPELFYTFRARDLDESICAELCRQWDIDRPSLDQRQTIASLFHDLLLSNFGVRQELYEQFYAGNPQTGVANYWRTYAERQPETRAVRRMIDAVERPRRPAAGRRTSPPPPPIPEVGGARPDPAGFAVDERP